MYKFSSTSRARLDTCHPDLQELFEAVLQEIDITIVCGVRTEEEQESLFNETPPKTQLHWPESRHNLFPGQEYSHAVDVMRYNPVPPHLDWHDKDGIWTFCGLVFDIAEEKGIEVRSGADWDGDGIPTFMDKDETFFDGPHWELK